MMTKTVNPGRAVSKQLALLPLFAVLILVFSTKVQAKKNAEVLSPRFESSGQNQQIKDGNFTPTKKMAAPAASVKIQTATKSSSDTAPTPQNPQSEPTVKTSQSPLRHAFVEVLPEFRGGMKKFYEYVANNFQPSGMPGTIEATFRVEENGKIVISPVTPGIEKVNEMQLRKTLANSPDWMPAVQNGRRVPVTYLLTTSFTILNNEKIIKVDKIALLDEEMILSYETKNEDGKALIAGTILNKDGKPVPGVSIRTSENEYGGVSSADGGFTVELPELKGLIFSCIGYSTKRLAF